MKGAVSFAAVMAALIALLAGPSSALAQEEGAAAEPAPATTEPATSETETTTAPAEEEATTEASEVESIPAPAEEPAEEPATESADAGVESVEAAQNASVSDQPEAEVESSSRTVTNIKKDGGSCGVTTYSATAQASANTGPVPAGCQRVGAGDISSDPNNPTVLDPINGVTLGIWKDGSGDNGLVHWTIISGSFTGTDAINLSIKGGPDPNGFTCQISASSGTTGTCHTPVNPNNGKFFGVSNAQACPGSTENPPVNPPPGGPSGGVAGQQQQGGVAGQAEEGGPGAGVSPQLTAAGAAVPGAGGLPVTGLDALWLFLIGSTLLGGGAILRGRLS